MFSRRDLLESWGHSMVVKELEAKFGGLLDAVPDAMILVDTTGLIVLANSQAERLFGYTREELQRQPVELLVPERFHAIHPEHRAAYARDPRTRPMGANLELWARTKDGRELAVEISLGAMHVVEGTFISVTLRDVAQRRKTEAKFRGLLEAAPDAIVIVDAAGAIALVNAQTEALFGYSRDELIGKSLEMLIPARHRDQHVQHRTTYFAAPRTRAMGSRLELQAVRKDGSEFPVEISLSPLETEDGMLVSAAIRDVTIRKETETRLKVANKELESFSYSIAHDLRAPLRAMSGFAQILLEDYADRLGADGLDSLNEIRTNAQRMAGMIDALLNLARVARTDLAIERTDLGAIARSIGAQLATATPQRIVDFRVADKLWANADVRLVRVLYGNLLENAWKFTAGRSEARIEVGSVERDGVVAFFVRDNGAGFDMKYAERLFVPFQRLHSAREFPGTGIGLATAQRIVHRHGGRIWAEAAIGEGTTIYFTLPGGGS